MVGMGRDKATDLRWCPSRNSQRGEPGSTPGSDKTRDHGRHNSRDLDILTKHHLSERRVAHRKEKQPTVPRSLSGATRGITWSYMELKSANIKCPGHLISLYYFDNHVQTETSLSNT